MPQTPIISPRRCLKPRAMRMSEIYDTQVTKRRVNLTMNGDLVENAWAEGLNLSALAEQAVAAAFARRARERWDVEIAKACAALPGGIRVRQRSASGASGGRLRP
jgi:post-segregation antitoxin (ccd killing protein)